MMKDVLLVGNPNAGKTTLFNSLTKSTEHTGNWHGVTVDTKKKKFFIDGAEFYLIDTPGIYSLCPLSFEEKTTVEMLEKNYNQKIINICDKNNLQRNLYLTLCLLEQGFDVVLVINEIDKKNIFNIDCQKLSSMLGIDVVYVNAEKGVGIDNLKNFLKKENDKKENFRQFHYVKELSKKIKNSIKIDEIIKKNGKKNDFFAKNCLFYENIIVLKAYEKDEEFFKKYELESKNIFLQTPENSMQILAKARFDFIDEILKKCAKRTHDVYGYSKFDKIVLNKWLAFPIFISVLALIFYLTFFSVGAFFSEILSKLLDLISSPILSFIKNCFGQNFVYDIFNVAIFGGVSTVLSFLPQIALLFFFLSILEDSGYMSRIAFIFEDILGRIGLSGKSVYTLLMGFGCSTSAIMTSRNMDDKNAKIKTAILCPYMSCTAKIPIYTVVGGAFFGAKNIFVILGLYFLGVAVAILISKILDVTLLKSKKQTFILEFPPYRVTSLKRAGLILWKNTKEFLLRVGSVMISMNVIIWFLSSFSFSFKYVAQGEGISILEQIGKFLAPIFSPLGFGNWAIISSLIVGVVAKEVVVSSIAMFNGIDSGATKLLSASLLLPTSVVFFSSKASVLSFLVFCLLYTPCIASVAMLFHEVGKKWTFISILIQFFVAYVLAYVVYQIYFACEVFGFLQILAILTTIFCVFISIFVIFRKIKRKKLCLHCDDCGKDCFKH